MVTAAKGPSATAPVNATEQSSQAEAFKCMCQDLQDNGVVMPRVADPSAEGISKLSNVDPEGVRDILAFLFGPLGDVPA